MASTNAMYTGLSGMNANARRLDVIGNNIANANTAAFKSSSMYFETQFSRTLSNGTQPSTNDGGTNPYQIGLGVKIAGTTRDFNPGNISATGNGRDMTSVMYRMSGPPIHEQTLGSADAMLLRLLDGDESMGGTKQPYDPRIHFVLIRAAYLDANPGNEKVAAFLDDALAKFDAIYLRLF